MLENTAVALSALQLQRFYCEDVAVHRHDSFSYLDQWILNSTVGLHNITHIGFTLLVKKSYFLFLPSQLINPSLVEGLVLINVDPCAEGWIDWAASKVSITQRNPEHPQYALQHGAAA